MTGLANIDKTLIPLPIDLTKCWQQNSLTPKDKLQT